MPHSDPHAGPSGWLVWSVFPRRRFRARARHASVSVVLLPCKARGTVAVVQPARSTATPNAVERNQEADDAAFIAGPLRGSYAGRPGLEWHPYGPSRHSPGITFRRCLMLDLIYLALGAAIFAAFAVGTRAAERM